MTARSIQARRRGFTLVECTVALAALVTISVPVAELATRALTDRARTEGRVEATQTVENVLEQARALPWDGLTPAWATGHQLPDSIRQRWPNATLAVRVAAEPTRPRVKRVTVELRWGGDKQAAWPPVTMTALFAARTAGGGS